MTAVQIQYASQFAAAWTIEVKYCHMSIHARGDSDNS